MSGNDIDLSSTNTKNVQVNQVHGGSPRLNSPTMVNPNATIDIGLDLLANVEKKRPTKNPANEQTTSHGKHGDDDSRIDIDSAFDLNNMNSGNPERIEEFDLLGGNTDVRSQPANLIDLDKHSRLDDAELEALVDEQDEKGYVSDLDGNAISINSKRNMTGSINMENRSHRSSAEIHKYPHIHRREPSFHNAPQPRRMTLEEERNAKAQLLMKFDKLKRLGVPVHKPFNYSSDLNEMQTEYKRIQSDRSCEKSIRFQKKMLMAFVTGVEFLNDKFDPFDAKLDGWSESVHENIGDYNDVFEELYEKYKDKAKMHPELKLLFMVGGSAFMFHLTNTMFKSSMPGMGDIMKQNPELMKQFAQATMNSMSGDAGSAARFFASQQGGGQSVPQQQAPPPQYQPYPGQHPYPPPYQHQQQYQQQQATQPPPYQQRPVPQQTQARQQMHQPQRQPVPSPPNGKKINPPTGVDDILETLKSNTDNISDNISVESSGSYNRRRRRRNRTAVNVNRV